MNSNEVKTKKNDVKLSTKPISSHLLHAIVTIPPAIVNAIHQQTISLYCRHAKPAGLEKMILPAQYIADQYSEEIKTNVKKFLFKHIVFDFLLNEVTSKRIPLVNYPRLKEMEIVNDNHAHYHFNLSVASPIKLKEWKLFSFKAPKRKRYKDLDKQVDIFMKREHDLFRKQNHTVIEQNDWVNFSVQIINEYKKPILPEYILSLWIKINNKYIEKPFHLFFLNKKIGKRCIIDALPLDETFQDIISQKNSFLITIKAIIKGNHFSLESFKWIFKLKNKANIHKKLIEAFSFRNDISQRRATIEEMFHLFFSKHRFEIPKHLVIRKQEEIIHSLQKQPDYQVYKAQKDFAIRVEALAEKLLKEEIFIDQIAHNEGIKITHKDLKNYLSLFNNERLKEFIYFKHSFENIEESDAPLHESLIKQAILREKTLNHILHALTK